MNRLYPTLLVAAALSAPAFAQNPDLNIRKQRALEPRPTTVQHAGERDLIWSNDFSNAADWATGNIPNNNDNWVVTTQGPQGEYAIAPIASTTASNGFALFDSDFMCGGNQNAWIRPANSIDLSSHPRVVLQFEQYYRRFQGNCFVETSTNGTTWTPIQINQISGNTNTPNPELKSVDVTNQIGGAATAWFRFRYQGGCDYAWMIDDVALVSLPDYEIIMDYGYVSQFLLGYEYARVPQTQMPGNITVGAEVVNFGFFDQENVVVTATLYGPDGGVVGTATTNVGTMNQGDTVVTEETIAVPAPASVGLYTIHYTMSSDQIDNDNDAANNEAYRYFKVTEHDWALDAFDVVPDSIVTISVLGTGSFADNSQDVRAMNLITVANQETYTGVEVELYKPYTDPGSYFIAAIYDSADFDNGIFDQPLAESDFRIITQQDLDNTSTNLVRVGVSFDAAISLAPGAYYVTANMYTESGSEIYIVDDMTVPQPAWASAIYIPVDDQANYFYTNGNAWAVRLSSLLGVGVQQSPALQGVTLYPNPNDGVFEVTMAKSGLTTVEVFNPLGQLVQSSSFNGTTTKLDLSSQAAGIYTVRVGNNGSYNVQRVAVK